jgi:arylformamidase
VRTAQPALEAKRFQHYFLPSISKLSVSMKKYIDLSHTIEHGMITYKGLPAPIMCDYLSREASRLIYEPGTEFQIGKIEMVANTGTYIDSPFHRYENGKDLADLPMQSLADLEVVIIRVNGDQQKAIDASYFENQLLRGKAILVDTGWSKYWRTDQYFENHPFLTKDAAELLVSEKVKLVGIDSHNIDDTSGKARPVHSILLKNEIPIVEHLTNVGEVPGEGALFYAVPPKVKRMGTFPVRAYVLIK